MSDYRYAAFYVCSGCCENVFIADDLRTDSDGALWCGDCYDELTIDEAPVEWSDLESFVPPDKLRIAELEKERDELCAALSGQTDRAVVAEAEVERLKAGGCARDQRTTQYCAEAVALQNKLRAVEGLPEKWRSENGDYPESKIDCASDLEAAQKVRP